MRIEQKLGKRWRRFGRRAAAARTGRIQWTARGVEECLRHVHAQFIKTKRREPDWEPYSEAFVYLRNRYGERLAMAHGHRVAAIVSFLEKHVKDLKRDGIIKAQGDGFALYDDALFVAFAKLPFDWQTGFDVAAIRNYVLQSRKPS